MIKEAHRSHPAVMDGDSYHGNSQYGGRAHVEAMLSAELPELDGKPAEYTFTPEAVDRVFNIVTLEVWGRPLVRQSDWTSLPRLVVLPLAACGAARMKDHSDLGSPAGAGL